MYSEVYVFYSVCLSVELTGSWVTTLLGTLLKSVCFTLCLSVCRIDWVMGYYSAGDSIEVYVNLGSLDPHVVEQQLADITGADITKFHVKQNEEPEFDYSL